MTDVTLRYVLYDTVVYGATANAESILFQVISGGDATHNEQFTNSRGAGVLPQTEDFVIKKISAIIDKTLAKADVTTLFNNSILEIRITDFTVIKAPMAVFIDASAFSGSIIETANTDTIAVGLMGDGYELEHPIHIPGATPFKVRVLQGPAVTAGTNVKIALHGDYKMAGQGF